MALWIIFSFYMIWQNIESKHSSALPIEETLTTSITNIDFLSLKIIFSNHRRSLYRALAHPFI